MKVILGNCECKYANRKVVGKMRELFGQLTIDECNTAFRVTLASIKACILDGEEVTFENIGKFMFKLRKGRTFKKSWVGVGGGIIPRVIPDAHVLRFVPTAGFRVELKNAKPKRVVVSRHLLKQKAIQTAMLNNLEAK